MSATSNQPTSQSERNARNTYWISLVTAVLLLIVAIISVISTIQTGLYAFAGILLVVLISIAAFISAYLSRRGRSTLGVGILIITMLVLSLALPYIAKGQGLSLGILVAVIVSGIATLTLPSVWGTRATVAAIFVGITIVLVDLYTPANFGVPSDQRVTLPVAIILSVIYAIFLAFRFPTFTLRTKLIIGFMVVAVIPLAIVGYQGYQTTSNLLTTQTNTDLLNTASLTAGSVDSFIQTELDSIRTQAQVVDILEYMLTLPDQRAGSIAEDHAIRVLQAFKRKDPVYISSFCLLDTKGIDILDTFTPDIGTNKSGRDYFTQPISKGLPYVSPVEYSTSASERSIFFSSPIRNSAGEIIGILRVNYNAGILQEILKNSLRSDLTTRYAVLVDSSYSIRLAHTLDPGLIFTSYGNITQAQLLDLQKQGRLAPGKYSDIISPLPQSVDAIKNLDKAPTFTAPGSAFGGEDLVSAGVRLKTVSDWAVLVREPVSTSLAPVTNQSRASVLLSLLMAGLAAATAVVVSQLLSAPITRLTNVAQQVSTGDLTAQAAITSQDEIGLLARTFNDMTSQLRQTLTGLEQRVQERTADLETSQKLTAKRAEELDTISQVSRVIASEQNLDRLLPLVTRLISERFNYYHTGIFLLDETQAYAVLRATNSAGGQRMLARGHKLEVGQTGLVGYVAQKGVPRIALDVGEDAIFFSNPDLPNTRSEMALPLNLRGKTIGVLDVQSTEPSAFSDADANTLGVLAEQVAIAIENARLFSETQRALAETQALYRQFIGQTWEKPLGQDAHVGYLQSMAGGKTVREPIRSNEINQAITQGEMVIIAPTDKTQDDQMPNVAIPIKLRDQVIGVMNVRSPEKNRTWNKDELALVQAVSERVAFALDNARLLEDSQRRAARERAIGEISTQIGKASDIDAILRSTVEELGKKLRNAQVAIKLGDQDAK